MSQHHCEFMCKKGLASIRRGIAIYLINDFNLSQKKVAKMLDLTNSAVCQYVSQKRGSEIEFDNEIKKEIEISTHIIFNDGSEHLQSEICRLCNIIRKNSESLSVLAVCND